MKNKLQLLYNTLLTIETKGTSTLTMSDCIKYLDNLINETAEEIQNEKTEEE